MDVKIESSWQKIMEDEFSQPYFLALEDFVKDAYKNQVVYPKRDDIFKAFWHCPFEKVKVVILGQDPYHVPDQAHGLSFSVPEDKDFPPSLLNIFKEIKQDLGTAIPAHGNLIKWANQGVLLLNATLTVKANHAGSHQNKGWEKFTDAVIERIAAHHKHTVFMLWGAYAQKKGALISSEKHLKLEAPHPSPLSAYRGFFGSGHFSKANAYLREKGLEEIAW